MKTAIIVNDSGGVFCGRVRFLSSELIEDSGKWVRSEIRWIELWSDGVPVFFSFPLEPMVFDSKWQAEQMAKKLAGKVAVVT